MKKVESLGKKRITLEDIEKLYRCETYQDLYECVEKLVKRGDIKPIKTSDLNGKQPVLYKRYHICKEEVDYTSYKEELQYKLNPIMTLDYYIQHMSKYKEDREVLMQLSKYLNERPQDEEAFSMNERSFQIWGREKYLQKEGGLSLLKRVGLTLNDLNIYETTVPLAYYVHHKTNPQNILIIENKDTFYSMRRHLLMGNETICKVPIGTLIYGAGKQVVKAFETFMYLAEPHIQSENNRFLYFGDLDYEGIGIYESLISSSNMAQEITIFEEGYEAMLRKYERLNISLPFTKEKQKVVKGEYFMKTFNQTIQNQIQDILQEGYYIPQEILNRLDF